MNIVKRIRCRPSDEGGAKQIGCMHRLTALWPQPQFHSPYKILTIAQKVANTNYRGLHRGDAQTFRNTIPTHRLAGRIIKVDLVFGRIKPIFVTPLANKRVRREYDLRMNSGTIIFNYERCGHVEPASLFSGRDWLGILPDSAFRQCEQGYDQGARRKLQESPPFKSFHYGNLLFIDYF